MNKMNDWFLNQWYKIIDIAADWLVKRRQDCQIGIICEGDFRPDAWNGQVIPTINGTVRCYRKFKPIKTFISELVRITYENRELEPITKEVLIEHAEDIILQYAFVNADNMFHNAYNPLPATAINKYGSLYWPVIEKFSDVNMTFGIEKSILDRITPPSGFTSEDISNINIKVRMAIIGPCVR